MKNQCEYFSYLALQRAGVQARDAVIVLIRKELLKGDVPTWRRVELEREVLILETEVLTLTVVLQELERLINATLS
jgi:hypothetical protein